MASHHPFRTKNVLCCLPQGGHLSSFIMLVVDVSGSGPWKLCMSKTLNLFKKETLKGNFNAT